jgi:hypothetical protein
MEMGFHPRPQRFSPLVVGVAALLLPCLNIFPDNHSTFSEVTCAGELIPIISNELRPGDLEQSRGMRVPSYAGGEVHPFFPNMLKPPQIQLILNPKI